MIFIESFNQQYKKPKGDPKSQWDATLQIDCTFVGLKQKVIVLFGNSRTGKSTLSNILAAKPMIGEENEYGDIVYKALAGDVLQTDGFLVSCTSVCNRIDFKDLSIIDLAGFQQTRGQNQLLAVVYNIKKLFQNGIDVKFLLTVSDNQVAAALAKDKFKPYFNFLSLFKDQLNKREGLKQKIFQATYMMFTKTTKTFQNYKKLMEGAIKALGNPAIKQPFGKQIEQFLEKMKNQERFDIFPQAQVGNSPPSFDILQKKNWQFFNLEEERKAGKFWSDNFLEMFNKMDRESQEKFNKSIKSRIEFCRQAAQILQSIINICTSNQNWYKDKIDYSPVTQQMKKLNENHNYYTTPHQEYARLLTGQLSLADQYENVKQTTGLQLIKLLTEIYTEIMNLSEVILGTSVQNYERLFEIAKSVLGKFKLIYSSNSTQQKCFLDFSFTYLRGIIQFSQLCQIDSEISSTFPLDTRDSLSDIFKETMTVQQYLFIQNMPPETHQKLFDSHEKRQSYKNYVDDFFKNISTKKLSGSDKNKLNLTKMKFTQIQTQIFGADALIKDEKNKKALKALLDAVEKIEQYAQNIKDQASDESSPQAFENIKETEMMLIVSLKKIANGLSKDKNQKLAIKLYDYINFPINSIECRKRLISQTNSQAQKFQNYIQLGNYSLKIGKKELALDSYYNALQGATTVDQRQQALKKLSETDKETSKDEFIRAINTNKFQAPASLLNQVKQYLQKKSETSNLSSSGTQ